METENKTCDYRQGSLPACAPLAVPYVPMQQSAEPAYKPGRALIRGTLFPGLDLPFMNLVNDTELSGTPLGELMALDFVIKELQLYLDTHKNDEEAFATLQSYIKLYNEGKEAYVRKYGPLTVCDLSMSESYDWLKEPWPWDYNASKEG